MNLITDKQSVESFELLAFLDENQELSGVAKVEITILNGWKLDEVNTFGRPKSDFACLYHDFRERVIEAGFDVRNFDFGTL